MKLNRRIVTVAVALLLLCGSAWAQDAIKVGVVGPRTGPAAATGQAFDEGIKLATEYVNSKGGVLGKKLEVVFEDTAGPRTRLPPASSVWSRATRSRWCWVRAIHRPPWPKSRWPTA